MFNYTRVTRTDLRDNLSEYVKCVAYGGEIIIVTFHGREDAVIIPDKMYRTYRTLLSPDEEPENSPPE